jgi:hypothetical protein
MQHRLETSLNSLHGKVQLLGSKAGNRDTNDVLSDDQEISIIIDLAAKIEEQDKQIEELQKSLFTEKHSVDLEFAINDKLCQSIADKQSAQGGRYFF